MQTPVQFVSQPSDGILQIHIWYGKEPGRFTYYEDDGTSFDYETGNYYKREISWDPAAARITLAAKQGSFHTRFGQVKLVLHKFPGKPLSVKVNGRKILLQAAEDTRVALFANTDKQLTISVPGK